MKTIFERLNDIEKRLSAIEDRLGLGTISQGSQNNNFASSRQEEFSQDDQSSLENRQEAVLPEDTQAKPSFAPRWKPGEHRIAFLGRKPKKGRFEANIGRWWFGIIGVVAILFGVGFFLKYAFENNLIGEAGRVILGISGGVVLVILGEWLRLKYEKYSYILTAGGLSLFYLSIYAALHFYHLISQTTTFMFMAAVTVFGALLSLFANSLILAFLTTAGGFLVPYLVSTGKPNDIVFFAYLAILTLGVLIISLFKKWHPLNIFAFAAAAFNFVGWYAAYYSPAKLAFAIYVLVIFYLLYLLIATMANLMAREKTSYNDLAVLVANPLWFFTWIYFLLKPHYEYTLGFIAGSLAALYIGLTYLSLRLRPQEKNFPIFLSGLAVLFLTIAIPLQFNGRPITITWAVESVTLFATGIFIRSIYLRYAASVVFVIALIRLFSLDSSIAAEQFTLILNPRFFVYLAVIICAGTILYLWRRFKSVFNLNREKEINLLFGGALIALPFILGVLEIDSYFSKQVAAFKREYKPPAVRSFDGEISPVPVPVSPKYKIDSFKTIRNKKNAAISIFWTIYAAVLISLGIFFKSKYIRWASIGLFALTIFKVFFVDLAGLEAFYRIVSFLALGIILLAVSYLYFRFEQKLLEEEEGTKKGDVGSDEAVNP